MTHIEKIQTDQAPQAIGPYSQAVKAGPFLFLSGMLPIDPKSGKINHTSIQEQTHQIFENIEAILKEAHLSLKDVVKMEVFLKDLTDFQAMNEIYAQKFTQAVKPARHAFQVARLPLDALIEITCTAYHSGS
jgi:2-iminobutanoate/2-iminopropanoate deaminase